MNEQSTKDKIKGFATLLVLALVFWVGCNTCGDEDKEYLAAPKMPTSQDAYYASQTFVTKLLKAPATAEFPYSDEVKIWADPDSTFIIKGFVDAQNSYGALLRTKYYARIKYNGNDMWQPLDVKLEE